MRNPLVDQVMGRASVVNEDDCVPVPGGAVTRRSFRDRMVQSRQRPEPEGEEDEQREARRQEDESMSADLRAVLGEAEDQGSIIPQNAEEVDSAYHVITARMNPVKDVVQEPSHPSGEKEKYLTPYAALTAPDATPEAMTPIDPSRVPGAASASKFSWNDLEKATPEPPPEAPSASSGVDMAVRAMDVLLGRDRASEPARDQREFARTGAVATEEAALAAMGVENPVLAEAAQAKAAAALSANPDPAGETLMPEHKAGDPKKVYEAARKFI